MGGKRSVRELYPALIFFSPFSPECYMPTEPNKRKQSPIAGYCITVAKIAGNETQSMGGPSEERTVLLSRLIRRSAEVNGKTENRGLTRCFAK